MGRRHGSFVGIDKIIDKGADAIRFNLVIFAEGYLAADVGAGSSFHNDALAAAETLLGIAPFSGFRRAINVHRVDVSSTEAGARDPKICNGSGDNPRTYFNASYCNYGQRDFLTADYDEAIKLANVHCPDWDACLILVNSAIPGGSAKGKVSVCAKQGMGDYIGHEMGHVFGLAEEYVLSNTPWTLEPAETNATISTAVASLDPLWAALVVSGTPMPTQKNTGCPRQQSVINPVVAANTIGTFEGAFEYGCGVYRPAEKCKMRTLADPFCGVCSAVITEKLTQHL